MLKTEVLGWYLSAFVLCNISMPSIIGGFYFPFKMFNSLNENEILNSIKEFNSNWSYMLAIIALTFVFFFLGKFAGRIFGKQQIKQRGLILSMS